MNLTERAQSAALQYNKHIETPPFPSDDVDCPTCRILADAVISTYDEAASTLGRAPLRRLRRSYRFAARDLIVNCRPELRAPARP